MNYHNEIAITYEDIRNDFSLIKNAHYKSNILLKCCHCNNEYVKIKKHIPRGKSLFTNKNNYCCTQCDSNHRNNRFEIKCANCSSIIFKLPSEERKNKSKNYFCNKSCSATYHNTHKKYGNNRSKLEIYLESKLLEIYPNLEFHFNRKDTINSELDIYIPSLKLAFELNGIFHYEPIFGDEKLQKQQSNDTNKFQKCQAAKISLCIIDTTSQRRFSEQSSKKFLDIICKIINNKI